MHNAMPGTFVISDPIGDLSNKKSPECTKSFSKLDNKSAVKGQTSKKLVKKNSSKRIRPSSHRRIIRAKQSQESEVSILSLIYRTQCQQKMTNMMMAMTLM